MVWNGTRARRDQGRRRRTAGRLSFESLEGRLLLTADVGITGTATPNPVAQNGYLRFDFAIDNAGPDPSAVTFNDVFPGSLSIVNVTTSTGTITRTGNTVGIDFGTMASGDHITVSVLTVPTVVTTLQNTATITTANDPNLGNNSVTTTSTVQLGTNLVLTATATPNPVVVGNELDFFYVVTNNGPAATTNVVMNNLQINNNLTLIDVDSTQGTVTIAPDNKSFSVAVGNLAVGASARILVRVDPTSGAIGTVSNSATVTAAQPIINVPATAATATATVIATAPPLPTITGAPVVASLSRFGEHGAVTSLVILFSQPLDPATAQNVANYQVTTANARRPVDLGIRTVGYDATNRSVTLVLKHRLPLRTLARLTINGATPTGVANLNGVLLAGAGPGQTGTNFVRTFLGFGPGSLAAAT